MPKPHTLRPNRACTTAQAVGGLLLALGLATGGDRANAKPDTAARPTTASEIVSARIQDAEGFAWNSRFRARADDNAVLIELAIDLVPAPGVAPAALGRARERWRDGIEGAWGGRFGLRRGDGRVLPIQVRVQFQGPRYDHRVVVYPGRGTSHQLRWHLNDPPEIAAHEAGHMLGTYDEYPLGALDPRRPIIDPTGIMSATPVGAQVKPRHLEAIRAWYADHADDPAVTVVPLPDGSA